MTVEPLFGALFCCTMWCKTACLASSVVISRYAHTTYVTLVCGSRILARGVGLSMLGLLRVSCAGAYAIAQGQEQRDNTGLAAAEGELAQCADVRGLHAVNFDRVSGVRA